MAGRRFFFIKEDEYLYCLSVVSVKYMLLKEIVIDIRKDGIDMKCRSCEGKLKLVIG
ncbi:MAG: hypothetical protein ISR96_09540 [Nitrospira sp.]|nr:hypothetical protein [bacterium]MBL7049742.1 hypothetical protein [Nitrospira sp.]